MSMFCYWYFYLRELYWNQRQGFIYVRYGFSKLWKKKTLQLSYRTNGIESTNVSLSLVPVHFDLFLIRNQVRKWYAKLPNSSTDLGGDFLVLFAFFYLAQGRDAAQFLSSWFSYDFTRIALSFNPIFFFVTLYFPLLLSFLRGVRTRCGAPPVRFLQRVYRISFTG